MISGLSTRIVLGPFGYTGAICRRREEQHGYLSMGRMLPPWGSRKMIRLALKKEMARIRREQPQIPVTPQS